MVLGVLFVVVEDEVLEEVLRLHGAVLLLARPTHDSVNNMQGEKHVFN